jgi:hypothetical protein
MLIVEFLLITMIYGFIMVGLKDSISPIKKRLLIMFNGYKNNLGNKKTRDGDLHQQRRALCWTNAPLTSPTKT